MNTTDYDKQKNTLFDELQTLASECFNCRLKIAFPNRNGKLYVKIEAPSGFIGLNNATSFREKAGKLIVANFPDASVTSGGMGTYTFRLNKDILKPVKSDKEKRIKFLKNRMIKDAEELGKLWVRPYIDFL